MKELVEQLKNLWNQMDKNKRIFMVVLPLLILILLVMMILWMSSPKYELLYGRLTEQDRSEIIAKLEEMKVPYKITVSGGIEVPNAASVRANLLMAGIPHGGVVGWEVFDKSSFTTTDFNNAINRQRAISGELTRTIQRINGIIDAKVLLNIPNSSEYLFADDKPEGTASVQLQLRMPGVLSEAQVEAIANLVAASTGVKPESVTIVDNYANDLTAMLRIKNGPKKGLRATTNMFAAKLQYENQLEARTESMLTKVFGFNKTIVRINAELDMDYKEIKSQSFGDKGVPRSEQERTETTKSNGSTNNGAPGTDSNITTYRVGQSGSNNLQVEKTDRTVNYEVNKTEEFRIAAPGRVKRLTVGIWIDGELQANVKQKVINTIGASLGILETRGDKLTVESMKFTPMEPITGSPEGEIPWLTIVLVLGGVILIMAGFFMKSLMSRKKKQENADAAAAATTAQVGANIDATTEDGTGENNKIKIDLSPEEKARRESVQAIEKWAREKPDEVAILLKAWISED